MGSSISCMNTIMPIDHVLIEEDEDCRDAYFVRVKDPVAILKMSDPNLQLTICKLDENRLPVNRGIVEGATHILYETNLEDHRKDLELFIKTIEKFEKTQK